MEDTPLGQMLLERGIEKGREEGLEKGREEGLATEARRLLLRAIRRRFGEPSITLESWAERQELDKLERALDIVLEAGSMEEVSRRILDS